MSTFYATFESWDRAKGAVQELLNGGVDPGDLSLVACRTDAQGNGVIGEMRELPSTVGDATVYIGRKDDPARDFPIARGADLTELTSTEMSRLSPVDTSNSDTNVEAFEQMEDSQNEYELQIRPKGGISYGMHDRDTEDLEALIGFPTPVPTEDALSSGVFKQQEQFDDSLETIEIEGFGTIAGGGLLATAALDFAKTDGSCNAEGLVKGLEEEGVPQDVARDVQSAFHKGAAVLAVVVTPGVLNEDAVEEIAERHGAHNVGLFDAPRY